jgi:serine O-acetyltransferase
MQLVNISKQGLVDLTSRQVANLYPDGRGLLGERIASHVDEALERTRVCINAVRMWREEEFNYLHSSQYCTYLYFLANTIWRNTGDSDACTRLFLLNKALNAIDCFYEIELPDIFFIGHSVGIVLSKATYGRYLVLYQNSTVGKNHGVAPVIGEGVVMYPNSAIIGRCHVGARTVLSQGTSVVNADTPGNVVAFNSGNPRVAFKPLGRDVLADIFR